MSTHVRTQIRQLFKSRIVSQTDAGSRVHVDRIRPYEQSELPAINVSLGDESIDRDTMDKSQRRLLQVFIDIAAEDRTNSPVAGQIDKIAMQLEQRLVAGSWSEALMFDVAPVSINQIFDGEGRVRAGELRLVFNVEYHTREGIPTAVI